MKIYVSGWQGATLPREKRLLRAGITHQCYSFINIQLVPEIKTYYIARIATGFEYAVKHAGIMMDSGVYSMRRYITRMARQGLDYVVAEKKFMRQYVEYCRANQHRWDFFMTTDFQPVQPEIYKTHLQLEKMGVRPMPVFHGDASIDYLKRYRDRGYDYVGIGAGHYIRHKRRHLDLIFNFGAKHSMGFHGLAITSPGAMMNYPFISVDSSSWSRVAAVGGIMRFNADTHRMDVLHVSDQIVSADRKSVCHMPKQALRALAAELEAEGVGLNVLQTDFVERHIYNAKAMMQLAAAAAARHRHPSGGFRQLV